MTLGIGRLVINNLDVYDSQTQHSHDTRNGSFSEHFLGCCMFINPRRDFQAVCKSELQVLSNRCTLNSYKMIEKDLLHSRQTRIYTNRMNPVIHIFLPKWKPRHTLLLSYRNRAHKVIHRSCVSAKCIYSMLLSCSRKVWDNVFLPLECPVCSAFPISSKQSVLCFPCVLGGGIRLGE